MATRYNYTGKLVTDGLVLNLDAAKKDSYPGSGTTWYDLSGNGNNGTLTNGPTYTGVSKDAAIVFDGANDYVDISGSSISSFGTGNFGISTWVNFNTLTTGYYRDIIGSSTNSAYLGANKSGWVCAYYSGSGTSPQFKFSYQSNNSWIFEQGFSTKVTQNQWYSINYIRNSGIVTLYQNGSPVSSSLVTTNITSTEPFIRLGGGYGSGGGLVNGKIANTQIYNQSLTQFEVFQNFNAMKGRYGIPDIVTDGLVLNLDAGNPYSYLSGSSGTTWTDVSGQGNNGTLTNGALYANGAISFDGVDDYVSTNTNSTLTQAGNTQFTAEFWVKKTASNKDSMIGAWNNSGRKGWFLQWFTDSVVYFGITNGGNNYNWVSLPYQNQWFCIVGVFDGSQSTDATKNKIFINGVQQTLNTTSQLTSVPTDLVELTVGKLTNYSSFTTGNISNTKIYNRALTQSEITQNFNALRGRYGI